MFKKLVWAIKRHPFLYTARFKLLSKNSSDTGIENESYNLINKKDDLPEIYTKLNAKIFKNGRPESTLDTVKSIALWITFRLKDMPGLSEPSGIALEKMIHGQGGVCSDMAQVFNNFCLLNDILVREWGVTRAPFDETYGGHSFNEVYLKEDEKWVLFDSFWCVYFSNANGVLYSVTELFKSVREKKQILSHQFYQLPYLEPGGYKKNYFNPHNVPFLIADYSNKLYDTFLKKLKPFLPIFVIHFILFIIGKSYHYKFPLDNYKEIFNKN